MEKSKSKSTNKSTNSLVVHVSPELLGYPPHTHGLTGIGMPEFIIDPLAFGPEANAGLIKRAYDFFVRPENKPKLESILRGQTVKLTRRELQPRSKGPDPLIYCFKKVPPTFEMVKLAYPDTDVKGMRFIQIYVEGDDFALTDEYYKGGVKW